MPQTEHTNHYDHTRYFKWFYTGVFSIALLTSLWMGSPPATVTAQEVRTTPTPTTTVTPEKNKLVQAAAAPDIFGGKEYPAQDFSMVGLYEHGTNTFICGGSYIGTNWILSAGHCPVDENTDTSISLDARLCITNNLDPNQGETIRITRVILHRKYPRGTNAPADNDLSLLRLDHTPTCGAVKTELVGGSEVGEYEGADKQVFIEGWGEGSTDHHGALWYAYGYIEPSLPDCTESAKVLCIEKGDGSAGRGDSGGKSVSYNTNNDPDSGQEVGVISKYVPGDTSSVAAIAVRVSGQREFIDGCQAYTGLANPLPNLCSAYFPNQAPNVLPDYLYVLASTSGTVNVTSNDSDPDFDPVILAKLWDPDTHQTISWITPYTTGDVVVDAPSQPGIYRAVVEVCDDKNVCTDGTLTIEVACNPNIMNCAQYPTATPGSPLPTGTQQPEATDTPEPNHPTPTRNPHLTPTWTAVPLTPVTNPTTDPSQTYYMLLPIIRTKN